MTRRAARTGRGGRAGLTRLTTAAAATRARWSLRPGSIPTTHLVEFERSELEPRRSAWDDVLAELTVPAADDAGRAAS